MPVISDDLTACVLVLNDEYYLPYTLEASRGWFSRYVIYDVGSTDRTKDIISWFIDSNDNVEYFIRDFDHIPARAVQGAFRNSMIAEARTDWNFILDGDEVYNPEDYQKIADAWDAIANSGKLYGVINRREVSPDLTKVYTKQRTHHRIYNRKAIFTGGHPGEAPLIEQNPRNEIYIPQAVCTHFHNTERSTKESDALKRQERKTQHTYHPGELVTWDILKEVPILRKPIEDFPVAPALRKIQNDFNF